MDSAKLVLLVVVSVPFSAVAAKRDAERAAFTAYDTVKVADGIHAFMAKRTDMAVVSGNSVAVIGDEGVLVVDSGHFPSATRRMIQEIRALTKQPVRYLVNTHWHGDHIRGNAIYREAFPGVSIVSTPSTREQFENDFTRDEPGVARKQIHDVREMLSSGKGRSGSPLTDQQKAYLTDAVHNLEVMLPELSQAPTIKPSLTFQDSLTVYLGKREVRVLFLGRGNTGGDALVYVPDAKVLMTGDLVVHPAPYAFGSFIGEWGPTLRKAMAIDATSIVPGHGPVMHDTTYLRLLADLVESMAAQAKEAAKEGLSLEDARKKLDVQRFREQFAHGDEKTGKAFDGFFLGPGFPRAYREAKEGPLHDET